MRLMDSLDPTSSLSTRSWSRSVRFWALSQILPLQLPGAETEMFRHCDNEFKVLDIQCLVRVCAIEMNQALDLLAFDDRGT